MLIDNWCLAQIASISNRETLMSELEEMLKRLKVIVI